MDTKAEVIATQAASKLCLEDDMLLYEVKSTGGNKTPTNPVRF